MPLSLLFWLWQSLWVYFSLLLCLQKGKWHAEYIRRNDVESGRARIRKPRKKSPLKMEFGIFMLNKSRILNKQVLSLNKTLPLYHRFQVYWLLLSLSRKTKQTMALVSGCIKICGKGLKLHISYWFAWY